MYVLYSISYRNPNKLAFMVEDNKAKSCYVSQCYITKFSHSTSDNPNKYLNNSGRSEFIIDIQNMIKNINSTYN